MKPSKGLRLEGKKESFQNFWTITRPETPSRVRIFLKNPLSTTPIQLAVKAGDYVHTGQKIATASDENSANLFSSISGFVKQILKSPHPHGQHEWAAEIQSDGKDVRLPEIGKERPNWQHLSSGEILTLFQQFGIVDLYGREIPLHRKIMDAPPREAVLFNGCESEPYIASDYSLMMSHPVEILKGAEIIRRTAGAKRIVLFITEEKFEAIEILKSKIFFLKWDHCVIRVLKNIYPQGDESQLHRLEDGPVFNIATAFAAYEALALQKPFYERVVTVAGECVAEPRNYWLRSGTLFEDALKLSRGFLRAPGKILIGGPMRGIAQPSLDVPILASSSALLGLAPEITQVKGDIEPCIRCGKCLDVCPEDLSPAMISLAVEAGQMDLAREWNAEDCTVCGNCSFVCPSKRPLVEMIAVVQK